MEKEDRRFIEDSFPIRGVGIEAARERYIHKGHITALHTWWARRPLASTRAVSYAALVPAPESVEEWRERRQFIIDFSKWENSLSGGLIAKARKDILKANGGDPPKTLDPFGGGGTMPLEALRLGCEAYTVDYNPVATLILRCTVEYPQKFGNRLVGDIKEWGDWLIKETKREVGKFYSPDSKDLFGFIWANTIRCARASCGVEIPLLHSYKIVDDRRGKIYIMPYAEKGRVMFRIVGEGYEPVPKGFDREGAVVKGGIVVCPACKGTLEGQEVRHSFQEGRSGQRVVAVVTDGAGGRRYRLATDEDEQVFCQAEQYLKEKREGLKSEWGIDPVPDEKMETGISAYGVSNFGVGCWGDIFNARQKLVLITMAEKVRQAYKQISAGKYGKDYARAVVTYLALIVDRQAASNSRVCEWNSVGECGGNTFKMQALPMVWVYFENCPWGGNFKGWEDRIGSILAAVEHLSSIGDVPVKVSNASATSLPYEDNFFDAVITDPPYFDLIPYSYISDFFFCWMKRTVGDLYPELFSTYLLPKENEVVGYSHGEDGYEGGKQFFEEMLKKSFQEMFRVLKPGGVGVILYAHKTLSGWEVFANSLLGSGLTTTEAWPINTEMKARRVAQGSGAISLSVHVTVRKLEHRSSALYKDFIVELRQCLGKKLEWFWQEGIGGADFFIAGMGVAVAIFCKYEKVTDEKGDVIDTRVFVRNARKIIADFAVNKVLSRDEIKGLDKFYIMYRWLWGEKAVGLGEAMGLARECKLDLFEAWNSKGFIRRNRKLVSLRGPHERRIGDIGGSTSLIDVLHCVLLMWKAGRRNEAVKTIRETGYGGSDLLYRVAQAISETVSGNSREKSLLDAFLTWREKVEKEVVLK